MGFNIGRLYRRGLLELLFSAPLDSIPEFPKHDISYHNYGRKGKYEICEFTRHQNFEVFEGYPDGRGLPEKYKKLKLINGCVDPTWFLYLLTSDFDLHHWDLFNPGERVHSLFLKKYEEALFGK